MVGKHLPTLGPQSSLNSVTKSKKESFRHAIVCLRHRKVVHDALYEACFESGKDVWYLSIMSEGTLQKLDLQLAKAKEHGTRLHVLSWNQRVGHDPINAFRRHLGEDKDTVAQVLKGR